MRLLANDRSIVIKKADKGSRVVAWDCEDYIAEASKRLNDESVYKSVKFKDKVLQDLAEKSNGIFKGLKQKGKITEKQLKYFTIKHKKATNFEKMYLLVGHLKKYWAEGKRKRSLLKILSKWLSLLLRITTLSSTVRLNIKYRVRLSALNLHLHMHASSWMNF